MTPPLPTLHSLALACLAAATLATAPLAQAGPPFASTQPTPRVEHWQRRQADIAALLANKESLRDIKLVFVGDSITDFWLFDDNPWVKGQKYGRQVWLGAFGGAVPENRALNLGISGDRIEHVLFGLLPKAKGGLGELDAPELNPEFIVLLVGINNTWAEEDPVADSVFEGIRAVLAALHERKPQARIVLQSLLPTSDPAKNANVVRPVNARLAQLATEPRMASHVRYLDLYSGFVDASGQAEPKLFTDGLHPNADGYVVWRDRLVPFLKELRAGR